MRRAGGVDPTPRLTVLRVEEPGKRQAGAKVIADFKALPPRKA